MAILILTVALTPTEYHNFGLYLIIPMPYVRLKSNGSTNPGTAVPGHPPRARAPLIHHLLESQKLTKTVL